MASTPRPTEELFKAALQFPPRQREVLDALQEFPNGARAIDLAKMLNMHVNTARGHLEEMVNAGTVRVVTSAAQGRGRPSLVFHSRVPDNRQVGRDVVSLITSMAEVLIDDEQEMKYYGSQKARDIGRRWANNTELDYQPEDELVPMHKRFRELGYDPTSDYQELQATGETDIVLRACPFLMNGELPAPFICAIHDGYLEEQSRLIEDGRYQLSLRPVCSDGTCIVHAVDTQHPAFAKQCDERTDSDAGACAGDED